MNESYAPIENWERADHFAYYEEKIKSGFTMSGRVDVSNLLEMKRKYCYRMSSMLYYVITKAINQPENMNFRIFKKGEELFSFNEMQTSFTVFHEDDKTFTDLWAEYSSNIAWYCQEVEMIKAFYGSKKGVHGRSERPKNCVPISIIPWFEYDTFCTDTYAESTNYFPIITVGKINELDKKVSVLYVS